VNDGSNDDDNNDNNDVLLCEGCEDEINLACRDLAAVPDGDWFCRTCQPSASAKAAARVLAWPWPVFRDFFCEIWGVFKEKKFFAK